MKKNYWVQEGPLDNYNVCQPQNADCYAIALASPKSKFATDNNS